MTSPTPAPRAAEPATDELARFCIIFDETFGTRYTRLAAALKDYVSRHPLPSATAEDEVVREREACAELADEVYIKLIGAEAKLCPCGNGRVPTGAFRKAVDAYAAAIRSRRAAQGAETTPAVPADSAWQPEEDAAAKWQPKVGDRVRVNSLKREMHACVGDIETAAYGRFGVRFRAETGAADLGFYAASELDRCDATSPSPPTPSPDLDAARERVVLGALECEELGALGKPDDFTPLGWLVRDIRALRALLTPPPPPDPVAAAMADLKLLADDWDRRGDRHSAGRLRSALAAMDALT